MTDIKCCSCGKNAEILLVLTTGRNRTMLRLCTTCGENSAQHEKFLPSPGKRAKKRIYRLCSACGYSYKDFREYGFLGCARCYSCFSPKIIKYLKKIHSDIVYRGKQPSGYAANNYGKG